MQDKINALVEKLKSGNNEYFNKFYELTKGPVFYTIKKIVGSADIASDVMQDTYVSFINALGNIDENKNAYSYLITTAKNKAINEYKKVSRIEYIDFLENLPYETTDMDAPLLNYCKQHLTKEEFELLEDVVVYGYKQIEIAKKLKKPISTFNWQYNQLLKKINKFCKEVYHERF